MSVDHQVAVADNFVRRDYDVELGVESLVPIRSLSERVQAWRELSGKEITVFPGDLTDGAFAHRIVAEFSPDTIVHFAAESHVDRSILGP